jgi:hypothetical protein
MPDIYRIATRVQAHPTSDSHLAIEFINKLAENIEIFAAPNQVVFGAAVNGRKDNTRLPDDE